MRIFALGSLALLGLCLSQLVGGQAITEFSIPSGGLPQHIVSGPDGDLWFTESYPGLGRITTSGVITQIPISSPTGTSDLVFDPDGNLWFTEGATIALLRPSGELVEYTLPGAHPAGLAIGPDRNLWFTGAAIGGISRITLSGSISQVPAPSSAGAITAGSDGSVWFTESGNQIGRIDVVGTLMEFPVSGIGGLGPITVGLDGALWFTDPGGAHPGGRIGRITTSGTISLFTIPDFRGEIGGITSGPDGNIWFTYGSAPFGPGSIGLFKNKVGRITPDGAITEVSLPAPYGIPRGITAGSDGNLWIAEFYTNKIARLVPTAATCADDANALCLNGRFQFSTTWQSPTTSGTGTSTLLTSNTGAFWFFDPTNLELVVKVLDGRSINGKFWVFYGSLTNVEFTLTVTDTQTGAIKTYTNPQGQLASAADTSAF